ncbi:hypothetical protein C8R44DRAFT_641348, partial [Mycena epipterygia]
RVFDVFENRLNPPKVLPGSFNAPQHKMNRMLADLIPETTTDAEEKKFFSAPWTEDNIAWVNNQIRKHDMDSASGEDAILYAEGLEIPNDSLAHLGNECIRRQDGPSTYRIIALESCVLKILTLLIHKYITDWATSRGLIPDYQNGFREGYGTNNNPFILRCVTDWTRVLHSRQRRKDGCRSPRYNKE